MLADLAKFPVLCRPALPRDTEEVLELCSHIWEGEDYIPYVWQDWLADREGLLAVAECEGRVAGLGKLTRFARGDWFMEGLRVHPERQEQGIARRLNDYVLDYWRRHGEGTVRLATASYNVKVHHLCERNGFRRVVEFVPHVAPVLGEDAACFEPVDPAEVEEVMEFARQSESFRLAGNLLDLGWRWARLEASHLQKALAKQQVWWWHGRQGALGMWLDEEDEELRPQVLMALCQNEQLGELLLDYRRLVGQLGKARVGWTAPAHPQVEAALKKAGFERSWDGSIYIFELSE